MQKQYLKYIWRERDGQTAVLIAGKVSKNASQDLTWMIDDWIPDKVKFEYSLIGEGQRMWLVAEAAELEVRTLLSKVAGACGCVLDSHPIRLDGSINDWPDVRFDPPRRKVGKQAGPLPVRADLVWIGLGEIAFQQHVNDQLLGANLSPSNPADVATFSFAMVDEVTELAKELGWKPWKSAQVHDRERILDEYADVVAFFGTLTNLVMRATGATAEDLAEAYARKTEVNRSRFRGEVAGYERPVAYTQPQPEIVAESLRPRTIAPAGSEIGDVVSIDWTTDGYGDDRGKVRQAHPASDD